MSTLKVTAIDKTLKILTVVFTPDSSKTHSDYNVTVVGVTNAGGSFTANNQITLTDQSPNLITAESAIIIQAVPITPGTDISSSNKVFIDYSLAFEGGISMFNYTTNSQAGNYNLALTTANDELIPATEKSIIVSAIPTASSITLTKDYLVKYVNETIPLTLNLTGAQNGNYEISLNETKTS